MNSLVSKGTTTHEKHAFQLFDRRDTLIWPKNLALIPCNEKSSYQRRRKEMHKCRKLLNPNTKSPKKRKFLRCMNGDKFGTTLALSTREKYGQNAMINDIVEYCNVCRKDYSYLSDFEEFIEGSNAMKQGLLNNHSKDLVTSSDSTISTETSIKEKPIMEFSEDSHNSRETSYSLTSKNEDKEINHLQKNYFFFEDNDILSRVPIGPCFQADVPKWEGQTKVRHRNSDDDDDLKWLGTQLWPMPNITDINTKGVGEGRPDSCSCKFSGSVNCVKLHVSEAREFLKLEIGTTFSSWKFDEMGEDVSKSWKRKRNLNP